MKRWFNYDQLQGVKGLVKIRWVRTDHNAHVLVMDRLGPDFEKLRRFCRGAMSLKTGKYLRYLFPFHLSIHR